jgi:enoyl-CoA hydratase
MVRPTVGIEWHGAVVVVTIDRPDRRNAVDHATLVALARAQEEAVAGSARVLVLTGVESGEFVTALVAALSGFTRLGIVTMAAIDGPALGAGTQLAIACDVRIATARSVFGIPAAKLGLAIDRWTIERLTREFGWPVARAMLLTAETYTADRLAASGGVHRLGDVAAALAWAQEVAEMAPLTIAAHKLGLEQAAGAGDGFAAFESARAGVWASADAEEGRAAFLDKRPPRFVGR